MAIKHCEATQVNQTVNPVKTAHLNLVNLLDVNHQVLATIRRSARWWVAELYSDDMRSEVKQGIRDEHPNRQPYCDERIEDIESRGNIPGICNLLCDRTSGPIERFCLLLVMRRRLFLRRNADTIP